MGETAARAYVVSGREERAFRLDLGVDPVELIESLEGQVLADAGLDVDRRNRYEPVPQLGAGDAESGDVDRIDRVDAVADEDALAPAHHLVAGAHRHRGSRDVEIAGYISVPQHDVAADEFLRIVRQGRTVGLPVHHRVVVEVESPAEEAEVLPLQQQLVRHLHVGGDEFALVVVEVAVVAVDRVRGTAVGEADQAVVPVPGPNRGADRKGRVERARDAGLVARQIDRIRLLGDHRAGQHQQDERSLSRPHRARRAPHDSFCSLFHVSSAMSG